MNEMSSTRKRLLATLFVVIAVTSAGALTVRAGLGVTPGWTPVLLLTVAAGPLWDLSERAAENLQNPINYVTEVLGGEGS